VSLVVRLKIKVRFDYKGKNKSGKLFWKGKTGVEIADEVRQHKVSLIRNVPVQGIHIEEIDMGLEAYEIIDEITGKANPYAPVFITFYADSIEDAIKFTMKEEFRTVEVLEPVEMVMSDTEIERLLFKISEELMNYRDYLKKKIDNLK
jgi:hypothetical protein